jgi:hypothetical protein
MCAGARVRPEGSVDSDRLEDLRETRTEERGVEVDGRRTVDLTVGEAPMERALVDFMAMYLR